MVLPRNKIVSNFAFFFFLYYMVKMGYIGQLNALLETARDWC